VNQSLLYRILLGVLVASLFTQVPAAQAQSSAHLTVQMTGQSLTAGFNNTVTISVMNNYIGYIAIYDVDISVSIPAPLALIGDNHWHYDSIPYGQGVTITFKVYAPSSASGSSYAGTVTGTYKQLGDISYTSEVHSVSLSVTGWITLVVYGIQANSPQVSPGGNTTISGNVLNAGNLAAYNANATVESNVLVQSAASSVFLGEVDPNIPRPFSLLLLFKPNIANGNYSITVRVFATDNNRPGVPIIGQGSFTIPVVKPIQSAFTGRQGGPTGILGMILTILRNLYNAFFGSSYP
jgi:hypothetical protein